MAKERSVKVTKVEICMGDKTVALTVEEARSLLFQLQTLFGESRTVPIPYPVPRPSVPLPVPYPVVPWRPWRERPYWHKHGDGSYQFTSRDAATYRCSLARS